MFNFRTDLDVQARWVRVKRLSRHVWEHFTEDRCFEEAASLGYTSLFALVPLLAVVFGIVSAFPVFSDWSDQLKAFLFGNLMPAAGVQVETHLNTFLDSVTGLTLPGTVVLILTALLLMLRIEVAFNRVWRVDRPRTITNRIVMYWAVLTLGPIMIGAAIAISVQQIIAPLRLGEDPASTWYRAITILISWLVFTVMFSLVPNRSVLFRHAVLGAMVSAVLFELAKVGFVAYVTNANYTVIYGALATVPIFLLWLYVVWVVILLGASLTASLTTFDDTEERRGDWPETANFQLAYRIVGHLYEVQSRGERLSETQLLQLESRAGERQLLDILNNLESAALIARDEDGNALLTRDLDDVTLSDLYRAGKFYLPLTGTDSIVVESAWDKAFANAVGAMSDGGEKGMEHPLRTLFRASAREDK